MISRSALHPRSLHRRQAKLSQQLSFTQYTPVTSGALSVPRLRISEDLFEQLEGTGEQTASGTSTGNLPLRRAILLESSTYFGKRGRMALPTLSRQLFHTHSSSLYFRDVAITLVRSGREGSKGLSLGSWLNTRLFLSGTWSWNFRIGRKLDRIGSK